MCHCDPPATSTASLPTRSRCLRPPPQRFVGPRQSHTPAVLWCARTELLSNFGAHRRGVYSQASCLEARLEGREFGTRFT